MPIEENLDKILEGTDKELELILRTMSHNPNNSFDSQKIIDITNYGSDNEKHQVVTLHLGDKYAQFHDEFTQLSTIIPELKPLAEYILDEKNGWETNLD